MNIFYIDESPRKCAEGMVDKHVIKMPLETAQLLSTAHRVLDGCEYMGGSAKKAVKRWLLDDARETYLYHATHVNHPCSKWVRESTENYKWLFTHFIHLQSEFYIRRSKIHKTMELVKVLKYMPRNLKEGPFTPPPNAMDKQYIISDNVVENYRNYYRLGKAHLHKWSAKAYPDLEIKPEWI